MFQSNNPSLTAIGYLDGICELQDCGPIRFHIATGVDSPTRFRIAIERVDDRMTILLKARVSLTETNFALCFCITSSIDIKISQHKVPAVASCEPLVCKRTVSESFQANPRIVPSRNSDCQFIVVRGGIQSTDENGTIILKFFFSESLTNQEGEEVSTREVKKILKDAIEAEAKKNPLTDEELTDLLKSKGYNIARRTVAKYREQLHIPVARLRKEL